MKKWMVVIQAPDYEQALYVDEPDESTEDTVREKYSRSFTVYEVSEIDDEDDKIVYAMRGASDEP